MKSLLQYFNKERVLILFTVILFYGNTLQNNYSLDDSFVTQKNNITSTGLKAIPHILTSPYIDGKDGFRHDYRPVVKLSFAIEHELFGVNPKTSHLINILLYIVGLFTLLKTLKFLLSDYNERILFYAVLLFAILPIHTEVVASIKNRDVLLCFIFCMLALRNTLKFYESTPKQWRYLIFTLVLIYIALLSKLDALPYIAIIPICAFIKHEKHFKPLLITFVLLIIIFLILKYTRKTILSSEEIKRHSYFFENPLYINKTLKLKLITSLNSLGFYIQQSVFPIKMCCYYGCDTISYNKINTHGYIGVISVPLLSYYFIKSFIQKKKILLVGIVVFITSVSMYLNVVKPAVGIVADRFAFFSSLGITLIIVHFINELIIKAKNSKQITAILFGVLFTSYAYMTISRNKDWSNQESIIEADVNKYPNNVYLNYLWSKNIIQHTQNQKNAMSLAQQRENILRAKSYLEKSIAIDETYPNSLNYMSYIMIYLLNDFKEAILYIEKSLKIKETAELLYYKGICKWELQQKDSCEYYLLKSIQKDSVFYNAYGFLLYNYEQESKFDSSIQVLQNALNKGVKSVEIYNSLGKVYWQIKDNQMANKYYSLTLEIDPLNQEALKMEKVTKNHSTQRNSTDSLEIK